MLFQVVPALVLFASSATASFHFESQQDLSPAANCYWSGTSPFCAGSCDRGYTDCGTSGCGDGACCVTGYKKYCCLGSSCSRDHAFQPAIEEEEKHQQQEEVEELIAVEEMIKDVAPIEVEPEASCYWDGTSPFCAGGCSSGYSDCGTSSCGDGACCITGYKKYCCRGGCSSRANHLTKSTPPSPPQLSHHRVHKTDGDNDDICSVDEFLCCPPDASRNKDCKCINKKKAPHDTVKKWTQSIFSSRAPDGQLCKDKEQLCCNPGAGSNEECACI